MSTISCLPTVSTTICHQLWPFNVLNTLIFNVYVQSLFENCLCCIFSLNICVSLLLLAEWSGTGHYATKHEPTTTVHHQATCQLLGPVPLNLCTSQVLCRKEAPAQPCGVPSITSPRLYRPRLVLCHWGVLPNFSLRKCRNLPVFFSFGPFYGNFPEGQIQTRATVRCKNCRKINDFYPSKSRE